MTTPAIGSRWLDTGAKVPRSVREQVEFGADFRRVIEVAESNHISGGRFVALVGQWESRFPGRSWWPLRSRRGYADVSTFGRRFKPLEET